MQESHLGLDKIVIDLTVFLTHLVCSLSRFLGLRIPDKMRVFSIRIPYLMRKQILNSFINF